jgi:bla regulator protein BlaR1
MRKFLIVLGGLAVVVIFSRVQAQSPAAPAQPEIPEWQMAAGGKAVFEVASVKQNMLPPPAIGEIVQTHSNIPLDDSDTFPATGGLFSVENKSLAQYILFAYRLKLSDGRAVSAQLPKWAITEHFDIEARGAANATKDQMRLMMQSLLADRFKLAEHFENRQTPVFALLPVRPEKIGAQLRPHSEDPPCPIYPFPPGYTAPPQRTPDGFPSVCGVLLQGARTDGSERLYARNVTMQQIAENLRLFPGVGIDRSIQDQTGLSGKFDFILEFAPEPGPTSQAAMQTSTDASGPTFLEALKDQLGLMLDPQIAPVEYFVVDHIEEPTAN